MVVTGFNFLHSDRARESDVKQTKSSRDVPSNEWEI